jgi:hypothetical protein
LTLKPPVILFNCKFFCKIGPNPTEDKEEDKDYEKIIEYIYSED